MSDKDKIKAIYSELQGLLGQCPSVEIKPYLYTEERSLWERYNELTEKLCILSGDEEYRTLKIKFDQDERYPSVSTTEYRGKVGGLISRLHGSLFSSEQAPFSGSPSSITNISQTQSVSLQVYVELGMQLQEALGKAETVQEKSFIEDLKDKITNIKSFIDFGLLIVTLASQYGITPERIKVLFGH